MIGPDGGKTKVIEQGGSGILSTITKNDPFKPNSCRWGESCHVSPEHDCMTSDTTYTITCQTCCDQQSTSQPINTMSDQQNDDNQSDTHIDTHTDQSTPSDANTDQLSQAQSVVSQSDITKTNPMLVVGQYRGQTGRTMHSRMAEHVRGLRAKNKSCPLFRHKEDYHKDIEPKFIMKPSIKTKGNLNRLATEAEQIGDGEDDKNVTLWNSKSEYGKSKLVRWRPTLDYV